MSTDLSSDEQPIPPSRSILDLDQTLQREALIDLLRLCLDPPREVLQNQHSARYLARLSVRVSYLANHCSVAHSGNSLADLQFAASRLGSWAQSLLRQGAHFSQYAARSPRSE